MNYRDIRTAAAERMTSAQTDPHRQSLIYAGAALGLSVLITVINFLLSRQLESTGGLAGIGMRSVLTTAQSVLSFASLILLPFWDAGYRHSCLQLARGKRLWSDMLLEGFRRWGVVLRLNLLRGLLFTAIGFVCLQAAGMLYMLSPFSMPAMEAMSEIMESADPAAMEQAMEAVLPMLIPIYVIFAVVLLAVLIPVSYRLRLADMFIIDERCGARIAMLESNRRMKGHCVQYFRLDLSFWWYFLAQLAVTAVAYGDLALNALGVAIHPDVSYFLFFGISALGQFLLIWRCAPMVFTAHALAYETLTPEEEPLKIEN